MLLRDTQSVHEIFLKCLVFSAGRDHSTYPKIFQEEKQRCISTDDSIVALVGYFRFGANLVSGR